MALFRPHSRPLAILHSDLESFAMQQREAFVGTTGSMRERLARMKVAIKDGALRFEVHAKPRAKKSAIVGASEDGLEVRLAAPPVDGAANDELVRFLASCLALPKKQVVLLRGASSRTKLVEVTGLSESELLCKLGLARSEA